MNDRIHLKSNSPNHSLCGEKSTQEQPLIYGTRNSFRCPDCKNTLNKLIDFEKKLNKRGAAGSHINPLSVRKELLSNK